MTVQIEEIQVSVPSNDSIIPITFQGRSVHGTFLMDHTGFGNAPPYHRISGSDTQDGSTVDGTVIRNRTVSLRIGLEAIDRTVLEELRGRVWRLFSSNHELLLVVNRNDGTSRSLYGVVTEGTSYTTQTRIGRMDNITVVIFCANGISVGNMREVDISGSVGVGTTWTIPMEIPFEIGQGEWAAIHTTYYGGTYKSYPCIDVHGPANGFTLRNTTTGGSMVMAKAVNVGEVITVDMQNMKVVNAAGEDRFDILDVNASRTLDMYLQHGDNTITVAGSGFNANSRAVLSWAERWLDLV